MEPSSLMVVDNVGARIVAAVGERGAAEMLATL
jgi:hypothetical protein